MEVIKRDEYDTQEDTVLKQFSKEDPIIYKFQVAAVDHDIVDLDSPTMFVSRRKILFSYDSTAEVYDLANTIVTFSGPPPSFKAWQQVSLMGREYSDENRAQIDALQKDVREVKFSIDEEGVVPKDFMLRKDKMIQRPYQTWAFGRLIIDIKEGIQSSETLVEMAKGDFVVFNAKTVLYFIITTVIFFLLKWLLSPRIPDIADTILDVLFAVVLVGMGIWLYLSYSKNLKRYESVYRSYFQQSM